MTLPRNCSGLLGRTPLRQTVSGKHLESDTVLFRSSRPDSIETVAERSQTAAQRYHCSGLLGRTPLRHLAGLMVERDPPARLFRSSRPDSIETRYPCCPAMESAKSLFRSSRPDSIETLACLLPRGPRAELFRSSRPDSIETAATSVRTSGWSTLFRSSRPDSIETLAVPDGQDRGNVILFRSSRPDSIETGVTRRWAAALAAIVPVF